MSPTQVLTNVRKSTTNRLVCVILGKATLVEKPDENQKILVNGSLIEFPEDEVYLEQIDPPSTSNGD